jgi:HEAT repeat protein
MAARSEQELIETLRRGRKRDKIGAARTLSSLDRTEEIEQALLDAARDESWTVRQTALESLARISPQISPERLTKVLDSTSKSESATLSADQLLTSGLWRFSSLHPVETVIQGLQEQPPLRPALANALGLMGDARAVEPLSELLSDANTRVGAREAAAEALGRIGDAGALRPLITALDDPSWSVRRAAVSALAELGEVTRKDLLEAAESPGRKGRGARRAIRRLNARHTC